MEKKYKEYGTEKLKSETDKHSAHEYRWINAYARQQYGIVWSDNHVHLYCKYTNIK